LSQILDFWPVLSKSKGSQDSAQPGPVHVKHWVSTTDYFRLFLAAQLLRRHVKDYDPGMPEADGPRPELN